MQYQWIGFYELEDHIASLASEFLRIARQSSEVRCPDEVLKNVRHKLRGNSWESLAEVSLEIAARLRRLMRDPAVRIGMYCYFAASEKTRQDLLDQYTAEREDLVQRADDWTKQLLGTPRRALLHCLIFAIEAEEDEFRKFTWRRIIASLLDVSKRNRQLEQVLNSIHWLGTIRRKATSLDAVEEIADEIVKQKAGGALMRELANRFQLVILLDNVDQKHNVALEVRLVRNICAFAAELRQTAECGIIITVRNRTYASTKFKQLDVLRQFRFEEIQITPPDLQAVLNRRVSALRSMAIETGDSAQWFVLFVCNWVHQMLSGTSKSNVVDVISERHPHDIRSQLDLFCNVATSIHLHRHRIKQLSSAKQPGYTLGDTSEEFCMRALIWGNQPYYCEDNQDVAPNVYDNNFTHSPVNALLRCWLLEWAEINQEFTLKQLEETFINAGVSEEEIRVATDALLKFSLIRAAYEEDGVYRLTRWGKYFRENVAYELPYVQTVWWDTQMLKEYDIGQPRVLQWDELEQPAGIFEQWLRLEEMLAMRAVGKSLGWLDELPSVWQQVSFKIAVAIHRIEKHVSVSISRMSQRRKTGRAKKND